MKKILKNTLHFFDFLRVGGTVFMCNYPLPELKDGYFQRIRAMDALFSKRWRIYFNIEYYNPNYPFIEVRGERAVYVNARPEKIPLFLLLLCVLRCRQVYFHSIIRLLSPWQRFVMKLPLIKKIWDVHGAVPEETAFQGDTAQAYLFEAFEALAASEADVILIVSNAMGKHLCCKHGSHLKQKMLTLPIIAKYETLPRNESYATESLPKVIYAGGIDKWQQIPLMLQTITEAYGHASWHVFTQSPEAFLALMPEALKDKNISVQTVSRDELIQIYPEYDFGFVLRDSNTLNVVSCPTKLVEYIALGVIPILDETHIGDFVDFGLQYITKDDLIAGNIPDQKERSRMRLENSKVYNKIFSQYTQGMIKLEQIVSL